MDQGYMLHTRLAVGLCPNGDTATLLYIGESEGLRYIAPFVEQQFFDYVHTTLPSTICLGDIAGFISTHAPDLVCMLLTQEHYQWQAQPKDLVGVSRIHQWVPCESMHEIALAAMSKREARRRAQAISDGFSFDVSHCDNDFHHFYRTMHEPTMHQRYGDRARSVPEDIAYANLFKQGQLFRVHYHDQWVAGSVCQLDHQRGRINARLIGVLEGECRFRDNGSQNFVYHAIIEWACATQRLKVVDFQGCEPFLTKGTFQYKKRFGSHAVIPDNRFGELDLILRAQTLSPAVRQFLIHNPSIIRTDNNELAARYFKDARTAHRDDLAFKCAGMETRVILDLDQWYG
ncbi:hypothetical protein [Pseudomonas sp. TE3610]